MPGVPSPLAGSAGLWPVGLVQPGIFRTQHLTLDGFELTDAARTAALSWGTGSSGGMTDGRTAPAGLGIRRAATNLFRRGQCDATTDWSAGGSGGVITRTIDPATPALFSPQSIAVGIDGTAAVQGVVARSATGLTIAAATPICGSMWLKGTPGLTYRAYLGYSNGTTEKYGATSTFTSGSGQWFTYTNPLTGDVWELVVPASTTIQAGDTGTQIFMYLQANTQRVETFHVAHTMLESGQTVVSPYVATSGGATATHNAGFVQAPALLLNASQGWLAFRIRAGWGATLVPNILPRLFAWQDSGGSNFIRAMFNAGSKQWELDRSGGTGVFSPVQSHSAGDLITVLVMWTASLLGVSVNGGAFTTVANVSVPTGLPSTFVIGSEGSGAIRTLDSDVSWLASGIGQLGANDPATFNALGSTIPKPFQLPGYPTAVWQCVDDSYLARAA